MKKLTDKQMDTATIITDWADEYHGDGFELAEVIKKLKKWKVFNQDDIIDMENRACEIAMNAEEIGNVIRKYLPIK